MNFDAVISNPPYSLKWSMDSELAINGYPLAPRSKADWQFILQGLSELDEGGTAVYVLPHGVLFRGATEGKIRKRIIDENYLDAVIGLPAKLFDVTDIPTLLMVLKKHRPTTDVLFIDASNECEHVKNKNVIRPQDVEKIVKSYQSRAEQDRYAHNATLQEIKDNDYNLNIPRYVDTYVPDPPINLMEVMADMQETDLQIAANDAELADMFDQLHDTRSPQGQKELETFRDFFRKRVTS
jgi:type I restriction enzyme M protein